MNLSQCCDDYVRAGFTQRVRVTDVIDADDEPEAAGTTRLNADNGVLDDNRTRGLRYASGGPPQGMRPGLACLATRGA